MTQGKDLIGQSVEIYKNCVTCSNNSIPFIILPNFLNEDYVVDARFLY